MTSEVSAREVLARIKRGRAANAPASPQQLLRAKVLELRSKPVAEIRTVAAAQFEQAKRAFADASGVDWYAGLAVRFANYARWRPARNSIDSAADSLAKGDADASEEGKRTRYVSAWLDATKAIGEIADEAGQGRTDLTMVLSEGASRAADEAKKAIGDVDWTPAAWLVGGVLALELLRR